MDELQQLREEIDQIDRQMVELFRQRMAVTGQVGQYKLAHGLPVLDAARERQVLQDKARLVDGDLRPGVTTLFQTIMSISRRQQRDMTREGADNPGLPRFVQALSGVRTPVEHPRVGFQGVEAEGLVEQTDFTPDNPVLYGYCSAEIAGLLTDLYQDYGTAAWCRPAITGRLYLLLSFLMRHSQRIWKSTVSGRDCANTAATYVMSHYEQPITVEDLADLDKEPKRMKNIRVIWV